MRSARSSGEAAGEAGGEGGFQGMVGRDWFEEPGEHVAGGGRGVQFRGGHERGGGDGWCGVAEEPEGNWGCHAGFAFREPEGGGFAERRVRKACAGEEFRGECWVGSCEIGKAMQSVEAGRWWQFRVCGDGVAAGHEFR